MNKKTDLGSMTGDDLIDAFCRKHGYRFEGDSGLDRLETLIKALGYKSHGFQFGNLIEVFLSDNSGAVERIIEFIAEELDNSDEWRYNMLEQYGEPNDSTD